MNESEETTEQVLDTKAILSAIENLSTKFDKLQKESEIQFEAIRSGIVANSAAFDRLQARVLNLSADVKELTEEIRQIKVAV